MQIPYQECSTLASGSCWSWWTRVFRPQCISRSCCQASFASSESTHAWYLVRVPSIRSLQWWSQSHQEDLWYPLACVDRSCRTTRGIGRWPSFLTGTQLRWGWCLRRICLWVSWGSSREGRRMTKDFRGWLLRDPCRWRNRSSQCCWMRT